MFRSALRHALCVNALRLLICAAPLFAQQPPETALISGRVVAAATGAPVKAVQVVLTKEHPTEQDIKPSDARGYHATTDAEGRFTLKDIKPGTYRLAVHKTGYVDQYYKAPGSMAPSPLTIVAGKDLTDVLFRLVLAGVISGRVINDDGEPMVGVQMQALMRAASLPRRAAEFHSLKMEAVPVTVAVTNDLGEYRLYGLPPGDYLVSASDSGMGEMAEALLTGGGITTQFGNEGESAYPLTYFPGTSDQAQAQPITIKGGDEVRANLILRTMKMVSVSGRVLNGRQPVQNAFVTLIPSDSSDALYAISHNAQTDAQGRFTIKGVPPGHYTASATDINNADDAQRQVVSGQATIDVADSDVTGVDVLLARAIKLSGRITSENAGALKLNDIRIVFTSISRDQNGAGISRVNKDGTFTTNNELMPGTYRVQLWGLPDGWYLKSVRSGTQEAIDSGLAVTRGAQPPLELVVGPGAAQIAGKVMLGDKPVAGATVWLSSESSQIAEPATASADQNGDFVVKNLRPGKYRLLPFVEADSPLSTVASSQLTDQTSIDPDAGQVITVTAGENKSVILRIPSPPTSAAR